MFLETRQGLIFHVKFNDEKIIFDKFTERSKSYANQRETTGSSKDSLQVHPFPKWELLLKERICSQME